MKRRLVFLAMAALCAPSPANAQGAGASAPQQPTNAEEAMPQAGSVAPAPLPVVLAGPEGVSKPACTTGEIAPLTQVAVEILDELGSKISQTGQTFRFRLAAPIELDGCIAVPSGVPGTGEIIHAKKSGRSGEPGEFIAAARFLEVDGRQLKLRSLQLREIGGDRLEYNRLHLQLGLFAGLFVKQDPKSPEVTVRPGTVVLAKTAEAFQLTAPMKIPSAAAPSEAAAIPGVPNGSISQ